MAQERASDDGLRARSPAPSTTMAPFMSSQDAAASFDSAAAPTDGVWTQNKRTKWTRLLLRELYDLGFDEAARALEQEARVQLRSPAMETLQRLLERRDWDQALRLLNDQKLQMKSQQAAREAALLLLQRKFIELLLQREVKQALQTFQQEILPVYNPSETEVQQLAELLLCQDEEEMKQRAKMPWQGEELRGRLEQLVSPEEIIPEGALRRLVQDGAEVDLQVAPPVLNGQVVGECTEVLLKQKGDVWELAFSPDGKLLASASNDGSVVLWELESVADPSYGDPTPPHQSKILHVFQSVEGPVECLSWSPDSRCLLCCGRRTSLIQLWDRVSGAFEKRFQHPAGVVTSIQWLPCGDQFISGSADKSLVLWNASQGSIAYQWSGRRALDIAVHPHESKVFALVSGYEIRVYDIASKTDELFFEAEHLVSCLKVSQSGRFLLLNFMREEQIVCIEIATMSLMAKYSGVREQRYVLRPCFAGAHNELVVSGSEDGKIYVWHRDSGKLLTALDGHASVVNTVVRNPVHSGMIASASDDGTVRLWCFKSAE